MPNRVIREGILSSERVNRLSDRAELFYRRLMSVADDFGRYSANPSQLRAVCFPLRHDSIKDGDVIAWLDECQNANLISLYDAKGSPYLEVLDFNQRTRMMRSKWPLRNGEFIQISDGEKGGKSFTIIRQSNDGQMTDMQNATKMTVIRRSDDGLIQSNPTPIQTGGGCSLNDRHMTVISFEPVKSGLYLREYEALLKLAQEQIQKIKADPKNFAKDLTQSAQDLIDFVEKEKRDGWERKVAETLDNPASYERRNPKPKTAALLQAWRERIEEIKRTMTGILN